MKKLLVLLLLIIGSQVEAKIVNGTVYDQSGNSLSGVSVKVKNGNQAVLTDVNGFYSIEAENHSFLIFTSTGFESKEVKVGNLRIIDVILEAAKEIVHEDEDLAEEVLFQEPRMEKRKAFGAASRTMSPAHGMNTSYDQVWDFNTEEYATIHENGFRKASDKPLSTFSIDVDAASYSNVRRFINNGQLPPKDAVRIEEMINYFGYDYQSPKGKDPFSINTWTSTAPWNEEHQIVQIGLQGKKLEMDQLPASNIVFLIDVSGSMSAPNKLPLLKSSFKLLANELRPQDKVSIVVYAGAAGLVLPPTDGNNKRAMMEALDKLQAGGSTAGGAGIQLAYKVAKEQFVDGGNNRVILATDGDFNIGASSNAEMERLIEQKRKDGIFLTVLGFGMGNYKDSKMEILADKGNGNYAYIDNLKEAKKVLVNEFGGTLFTIAKDVKIQVEFNPSVVQAYRLIGYENRRLNDEDFNDDTKDAGELGSGHAVTALYEIIPVGVESEFVKNIDPLKYQAGGGLSEGLTDELLTVKFRYKEPDGETSKLLEEVVANKVTKANENLNWSMAVAGFGMLLRDSEFKGKLTYDQVLRLARASKGDDSFGYRKEFIELVELADGISPKQ